MLLLSTFYPVCIIFAPGGVHKNLMRDYDLCDISRSESQAIRTGLNIFVSIVPTFVIHSG